MLVYVGPLAADGIEPAQQDLTDADPQGDPHLLGNETDDDPDQEADGGGDIACLIAQAEAQGHALELPGGDDADSAEGQAQHHLQSGDFRDIHGHADTQEYLDSAEDVTVEFPLFFRGGADGVFSRKHGGGAAQDLGILAPGGIDDPPVPKEGPECADLKEAPLVAHLHPLVQQDPSAVYLDQQVAHLGPTQHHGGQIRPQQMDPARQLSGGDAGRGHHAFLLPVGEGPQKDQPVHQGHGGENTHGDQLRVAIPQIGADTGEHGKGGLKGHGHRLVVVEARFGGAGDHVAVDQQIQL